MQLLTKMEYTHTQTTQLNTRKLERDFKIESQPSEVDRERDLTKNNWNKRYHKKIKSLKN